MEFFTEIRKSNNMTQEEIAKKAEIDRASYCNIENGKRRPSVDVAKRIKYKFSVCSYSKLLALKSVFYIWGLKLVLKR